MNKNEEQLIDAIGRVDVKYIDEYTALETETKFEKHRSPWKKIVGLAACLMLLVSGALFINLSLQNSFSTGKESNGQEPNTETDTATAKRYVPTGKVIDKYPSNSSACYRSPNPGEYFYFIEVRDAMKKYADKDVTYFLAIVIFTDNNVLNNELNNELNNNNIELNNNSIEMEIELQRLNDLGYHVGYATYWQYEGKEEKVSKIHVAGYFTKEELDNFCVNKKYGYVFSFMSNGDGSPVSSQQGVVTDFDSIEE